VGGEGDILAEELGRLAGAGRRWVYQSRGGSGESADRPL